MAGVNFIPVSHAELSSPLGDNCTTIPCLSIPDLTLWSIGAFRAPTHPGPWTVGLLLMWSSMPLGGLNWNYQVLGLR